MDKKEDLLKQRDEAKKGSRPIREPGKDFAEQAEGCRTPRSEPPPDGAIMEGVFPFTASMDGEAIKAFLIDLSRLPGATEAAEKAQNAGDEG